MSKETYEITKEAILAMAEECPEAKNILKVGFPKAFEGKDKYFVLADRADLMPTVRTYGKACGKVYWLRDSVNWEIKRDSDEVLCLIPTRKEETHEN